jgi:Bacterial HORMA domain 2
MVASGVRVRASVHVTARSFTYLVNEINRVFLEAITSGGLDPSEFVRKQAVIENGLRTWLTLRQLEVAYLEVYDRYSGQVKARIDLTIAFRDSGDERYRTDIEKIKGELAQAGRFTGCLYRVVVSTTDGAAQVAGWSETTLGSVDHLIPHNVGEVIDTSAAGASMVRWG